MDHGPGTDPQLPRSEHCDQLQHDVLAALAIANGFSSALQSAHGELLHCYEDIVKSMDNGVDDADLDQLRKLEQDCLFCLSRLIQCVEQLKNRSDNAKRGAVKI
jgi:hypothetical protein